jgi:licheninase
MKNACLFCLPLIAAFCWSCSPKNIDKTKAPDLKLVWSDEFNYSGRPDTGKWAYDIGGHGWGNQELQYYTDRSENVRADGSKLIIEARKEDFKGSNYTSCRLVTRGKAEWRYGRFEIRAKLPQGLGTWPAIWMLAARQHYGDEYWPHNGEIDIMEHVGHDEGVVHASVHTAAYNHTKNTQKTAQTRLSDLCQTFHRYQLIWTPEALSIGIDDRNYFRFVNDGEDEKETWPFNAPQFLLLNTAVGGTWGGMKGVDDSVFPVRMEVDYVRVWQAPK